MQRYETLVSQTVEENKEKIITLSDWIFEFAETGFQEYRSAALYQEMLEAEGFTVTMGISKMPTAFCAAYGTGKPVIGLLAEYDALPGLGQKGGCAVRCVTEENPDGHGCGHNLLGAGTFAAALAVKKYLETQPGRGSILLFGCPSEEKGNAKTIMARDGVFKQVDAALTWHPADRNYIWCNSTLANVSVYFDFKGVTSHAAAAPQLGRSALDAAELMSVGVNYLREHVIPEARIHYAYVDAGGIAPNVVQGSSRVHYFIRAPKTSQVLEIFERVKDIAKGAAMMAGVTGSCEIYSGVSDFLPNKSLSEVLYEAMNASGTPDFDREDFAVARTFLENTCDPEIAARPLDTKLPAMNWSLPALAGSTDVGDVSHVVPTALFSFATSAIGTAFHTWQATAQGNVGSAHKAMLAAGKAMAIAAIHVMEDEALLERIKEDWQKDTGGRYVCPISDEVKPRLED